MTLRRQDQAVAMAAFERRVAQYEMAEVVDNSRQPAGSPMVFACEACHGPILLPESYLTRPPLCYDCRDLADHGWIFEMPTGTGWNRGR